MKTYRNTTPLMPRFRGLNHSLHLWWEMFRARLRYHPEKRYFQGSGHK